MIRKNKFGIEPIISNEERRARERGPMGTAVREVAENLAEATEAKVEQRRQNAEDAREYRAAREAGRVLVTIPLADVHTDDLPRDRMDLDAAAASDEMEELKASIRARGQKEPIEVWLAGEGYQLKKGWRRLTALRQLLNETGEARFAEVVARVSGSEGRLDRYIDMVEENVVREDLTFAEMAQVAIEAGKDLEIEGDAEAMVGRLYGSLHKMKRSYIRSFVFLLEELGPSLRYPREVPRNLGLEIARALKAGQVDGDRLRNALGATTSAEEQGRILTASLSGESRERVRREPREKYEFHVGRTKVTARRGECRLVSQTDFTSVPRERLAEAVREFHRALGETEEG